MEQVRKQMREMGCAGLSESLKEFWDKLPVELESISWTQYTDYFNDGDECTFSVHTDYEYLKYNGIEGELVQSDDGEYAALRDVLFDSEIKKATWRTPMITYVSYSPIKPLEELCKFLEESEDFLKEAIGDHLEVTAHRDGRVETEFHEHE